MSNEFISVGRGGEVTNLGSYQAEFEVFCYMQREKMSLQYFTGNMVVRLCNREIKNTVMHIFQMSSCYFIQMLACKNRFTKLEKTC